MATIPSLSYALSEESAIHHLIHLQLPESADLFELADACTAYVSVLVETDDAVTHATLCTRLLAVLKRLRARCDSALPPYLVEQLIAGEKIVSCVPDCWQDTSLGGLCAGVNAGGNGRNITCKRGKRADRSAT